MPIAIVTWPINDVGGINSWCKNFVHGLRRLGIHSDTFYATPQRTFACDPTREIVKKRLTVLRANHLSYRPESLLETLDTLNKYSFILMLHPSPHPTKAVLSSKHSEDWMQLYFSTTPPKVVVFHDMNWRKTNAWFETVADSVSAIIAAQRLFIHSVRDYPADCPKIHERFPLDLSLGNKLRQPWATKRQIGVICTQWLKIKNHHKLLPYLPDIKYPMQLFGSGMEYHNLKSKGPFKKVIRNDHSTGEVFNPGSPHDFYGFIPYEQVLEAMARASVSIDLSTKGQVNMTHWEPLTVGTVSMVEQCVATHEDNEIPLDCCLPYDLNNLAEEISIAISSRKRLQAITTRADQFIKDSDCTTVVDRLLNWLDGVGVVERGDL